MLICNGGVPYADVFDHKPPIIYFFYALGHLISYKWGVYILFLLINYSTCILLFKISSSNKFTWAYSLCLFMNTLILFYSHEIAYIDIFTTRYLVMYLIIIFTVISQKIKNDKYLYYVVGVFLTTIFFVQTNEILPAIVFICFILFYKNIYVTVLKNLSWLIMGIATITIPIILYFIYNNALSEFIYQAFKFNFETYVPIHDDKLWDRLKNTYSSMKGFNLHYLLWASGMLSMLFFVFKSSSTTFIYSLLMVLTFFSQLYTTSLSNNNFGHYFFPFIAYFLSFLIIFLKVNTLEEYSLTDKIKLFISSIAFTSCIIYVIIENKPFLKFFENQFDPAFSDIEKSIPFEKLRNSNGTFYSWEVGNYITLNAKYNITAPTKWVYSNGLIAPYFAKRSIDKLIFNDLEQHQTSYVLTYQLPKPSNRRMFLEEKYVAEFYENVGINIWRRK